jgi:NDP-sugar pyrophosphorylase family protein
MSHFRFGGRLQAVVLVGGEGTRLRPLTYGTPKPMVPLLGVPFLERTLSRLRGAGVDEVILAAGYLPQAIQDHLGDGSRLGLRIVYVIESEPLGTAGAIKNVAGHIRGAFFVLNGDVLTSLDLRAMVALHREKGGMGVLHLIRVDDPSAFGCVVHDADGRISRFVEKPPKGEEPTNEVNAGTYLLDPAILDAIPAGRKVSIERDTFPKILAEGVSLYAYTTDDYWLDVGRPEQYQQAHRDVLDGKLVLGPLADVSAESGHFWAAGTANVPAGVRAPAFIADDVEIDPSALVGPYAIVGRGSRIGERAHVSDTILWDHVIIESDARIEGSILASGVRVGRGAHVAAGSVVGHDAIIESSARIPADARITAEEPAKT